jgi:hypothetical protein
MKILKKRSSVDQALEWNIHLSVSEYKERKLTFGKYVNNKIKDLPNDYLEWGILNLNDKWCDFFIREWKTRNPGWKKIAK